MKEAFQDDEDFSSYLSDFVQAARSVTWHMQKQYGKKEGFGKWNSNEWYGNKVDEMEKIPYLRFLIKARDYSEKEGPVPIGATRVTSVTASMLLVNEGSKPDTSISEVIETSPVLEPPEPKTISRWFWDVNGYLDKGDKVHAPKFEKADVIKTCEDISNYLDQLVNECEERFS
jgi:hypothetical protein